MMIDIYSHILPARFKEAFAKRAGPGYQPADPTPRPALGDIAARLAMLDRFEGLVQVLTPTGPCLERDVSPEDSPYLARLFNDEMAGLVRQHPGKFVAAVACLPLNDIPVTLKEIDRAINELGFKGILMNTPLNGKPLDSPELMPVYERMSHYDLPIWLHPNRPAFPDYDGETRSRYHLFLVLGWPYETSLAMARLVCSGVLERYPNLKFITHHAGAMIPFFADRIAGSFESAGISHQPPFQHTPPLDYFRRFYNDTALYGSPAGLTCAYEFFGPGKLLFGTDMPYGPEGGESYIRMTIDALAAMNIPQADKEMILAGNARQLLRLGQ
ncbi:MAG: amidohydrolase family protein [Chloroflexota bacterium]